MKIRRETRGREVPGTSHLEMLRVDLPEQNYALKLKEGKSITHNRFVVPDWGALRFDLHVPKEAIGSGNLKVTLQDVNSGNSAAETILLQEVNVVSDRVFDDYINSDRNKSAYHKLDYAPYGFDTFQLQVPDEFRGKVATLKFEVTGSSGPVYLDNVFFKSAHLLFGNPSEARYSDAPFDTPNPQRSNLLIERPEYAMSYNGETNILNWASWQLNKSWVFPADKGTPRSVGKRNFKADITLPQGFYQVLPKDYEDDRGNAIVIEEPKTDKKGNPVPGTENVKYVQGHLVPVGQRDRNHKDNLAISLLSNIVPQTEISNNKVWKSFEGYTKDFIKDTKSSTHNKEVYIIAGTHGTKDIDIPGRGEGSKAIKIPKYLWKVILVIDRPGQDSGYVTEDSYTIGLWMPNNIAQGRGSEWKTVIDPDTNELLYIKSANEIEEITGYDFFANLPDEIEEKIEDNKTIRFKQDISDAPPDKPSAIG